MNLYWKLGAAAMTAALLYGGYQHVWHSGYDTAVAERKASDAVAIIHKQEVNAGEVAIKTAAGAAYERMSNEQMAPVRQRIGAAPRLRPGSGICGPAASPKSSGVSNGAETDTGSGLVREDVDRDLRTLKLQVEEALETGRACQAKLKLEGFMP